MENRPKYYRLFPTCALTKGYTFSIISDLQRGAIFRIPKWLFDCLEHHIMEKNVEQINLEYSQKRDFLPIINNLISKEIIFISDTPSSFPKLNMVYEKASKITNAIIDFSSESNHSITKVVNELSQLGCYGVEMRFFSKIEAYQLFDILKAFDGSTIRGVSILIQNATDFSENSIRNIITNFPRVRAITVSNCTDSNRMINYLGCRVIFTSEIISSEKCCGNISIDYMLPTTDVFVEACNFNSCLNRKISLSKSGQITNCPSCKTTFGSHKTTSLLEVVDKQEFQKPWLITKDTIQVCKDCEFRYICIDCRAYIQNDDDILSKPLKCKYDPYTGKWS